MTQIALEHLQAAHPNNGRGYCANAGCGEIWPCLTWSLSANALAALYTLTDEPRLNTEQAWCHEPGCGTRTRSMLNIKKHVMDTGHDASYMVGTEHMYRRLKAQP